MKYYDFLYGSIEIPSFIEPLIHTKEMVRLRNISQSSVTNQVIVHGPIPSRFQHGMGVVFLAQKVLEYNRSFQDKSRILLVAALLHDLASPPFSHTGEHFLKEVTGKDGEEFLEDVLGNSETGRVVQTLGINPKKIVGFVTGKLQPFSDILNGSLDIDNLDNVARYHISAHISGRMYNPVKIASGFRFFKKEEWTILDTLFRETRLWKEARERVYKTVYDNSYLIPETMLYRALELAFLKGEIKLAFFFLDDSQAVEYLLGCNPKTKYLTDLAIRWEWYKEAAILLSTKPSKKFLYWCENWKRRRELAGTISLKFNIPEEKICIYTGKGRDKRRITLPFVNKKRVFVRYDKNSEQSIYRLKVFVSSEFIKYKEKISNFVSMATNSG